MIRTILTLLAAFIYLYPLCPLLLIERQIIGRIDKNLMVKSSEALVKGIFRIMLFTAGVKLTVVGKENIPKDRAVLYIPNHRSYFDILIVYTQVPGPCGIIGKDSLRKIPLLATWMDTVNCLLLNRENVREGLKTILAGIEKLKNGISILIFPEGTRSKEEGMLPFHEGSFKLATKSGCPIVPIALTNTDDIFEKHFPFCRRTAVTMTIGEPIETAGLTGPEQKELPALTKARIEAMLEASNK